MSKKSILNYQSDAEEVGRFCKEIQRITVSPRKYQIFIIAGGFCQAIFEAF